VTNKDEGLGIASFILGILGLLTFLLPYFGLFISVAAIVCSILQKKKGATKFSRAGFILGIIGTILNLLLLIIVILVIVGVFHFLVNSQYLS